MVCYGSAKSVLTNIPFLLKQGIQPSQLTMLSYELKRKGLWKGDLALVFSDAVKMIKGVLK